MDPLLEQLWRNATIVAEQSGVPAPALVDAYLRLGPDPSPEAIAAAGRHVVDLVGPDALVDAETRQWRDRPIAAMAERFGMTFDEARHACDLAQAAAAAGVRR
jgi:hypothetical protein